MDDTQKLIVEAVAAWNPAIGKALKSELAAVNRGGDDRFRADLHQLISLGLSQLDRNPSATRANLQTALKMLDA